MFFNRYVSKIINTPNTSARKRIRDATARTHSKFLSSAIYRSHSRHFEGGRTLDGFRFAHKAIRTPRCYLSANIVLILRFYLLTSLLTMRDVIQLPHQELKHWSILKMHSIKLHSSFHAPPIETVHVSLITAPRSIYVNTRQASY